jgi:hypothetical protein
MMFLGIVYYFGLKKKKLRLEENKVKKLELRKKEMKMLGKAIMKGLIQSAKKVDVKRTSISGNKASDGKPLNPFVKLIQDAMKKKKEREEAGEKQTPEKPKNQEKQEKEENTNTQVNPFKELLKNFKLKKKPEEQKFSSSSQHSQNKASKESRLEKSNNKSVRDSEGYLKSQLIEQLPESERRALNEDPDENPQENMFSSPRFPYASKQSNKPSLIHWH